MPKRPKKKDCALKLKQKLNVSARKRKNASDKKKRKKDLLKRKQLQKNVD